jgi:ribosomal protein S18 acetylase RimI-like enzyme
MHDRSSSQFFPKLEQLDQAAFGPTGIENPLHIALLAITSSHRNSGLGTRLLQHAAGIAQQQGADVSLNAEVPSLAR